METAARMPAAVEDTCHGRMHAVDAEVAGMRGFFWCTRKKNRNKKKQEAAG